MTKRIASRIRSPLTFFVLVFALSTLSWLLGAAIEGQVLPGIPVSLVMVLSPTVAAAIVTVLWGPRTLARYGSAWVGRRWVE